MYLKPYSKDFNLRSVSSNLCKKFKRQNVRHVVLLSYLKMQARYVHHVQRVKVKVMLMDTVAVAAAIKSSKRLRLI
jgi:hypothetical protein